MKYGMGYLAYALIRIKSMNMFSVNLQPGILLKIYWRFKIEPHCFNGCAYQRRPQILRAIFRNMGICDVFTAVVATENMYGFILLPLQSFVSALNQLTHCRQVPLFGIKSLDWFTLYIYSYLQIIPIKILSREKIKLPVTKTCFEISHMKFQSQLPRNHPSISSLIKLFLVMVNGTVEFNHLWLKPAYHMCFMIISYKVAT